MASTRNSKNNNPTGKNQYSGGLRDTVRNNPIKSAAAAGVAAAAGLFLWTKRDRISEQASKAGEKVGQWREGRGSDSDAGLSGSPMGADGTGNSAIGSAGTSGMTTGSDLPSGKAKAGQGSKTAQNAY